MNILIYRYGSICEPDIIKGFEALGNSVKEITAEIYNKNLVPADGIQILKNELLITTILFSALTFFPLYQKYAIFFKFAIYVGP